MKYKSDILEMIHENATANFKIGAISEARMREYDEMCLNNIAETVEKDRLSEEIKNINLVTV